MRSACFHGIDVDIGVGPQGLVCFPVEGPGKLDAHVLRGFEPANVLVREGGRAHDEELHVCLDAELIEQCLAVAALDQSCLVAIP